MDNLKNLHMAEINEQVLSSIVTKIVREVDPARIILFGSYAKDTSSLNSDLDLLIVEDAPFGANRARRSEIARIRRALSAFHIAKDILVYSTEEVTKWENSINHALAGILREGKQLYARS